MGLGLTSKNKKNTASSSGSTTNATSTATNTATSTSGGNTYQVQSNGKAPSGLSVGDNVVTQGGTYQITGVNADGTYQSTLVGGTSNNTASTSSPSQYTGTTSAGTMPSGFSGSANGVTTYNQGQSDILAEMNANSIAWHTASPEEKQRLAARNQALSQMLGGSVTFDSATGYWSGAAEAPVEVGEEPTFDYSVAQPSFGNSYGNALDEMLNKILTREDFSYNAEDDPLYQQYAEMYRREGDRARENTLADIASSAGGMNSWAVTAAQQAQNNYNAQLGDKIPELYQLAYQMYLNEKASMVEDFGLLQQMDSTQYNRYRDTMSDWRDDRDFAYGAYRDDMGDYQWGTSFNYGVSQDQINNAWKDKEWEYGVSTDEYNREQAENETAYNREQQEINDARAWAIDLINAGTTPDAATLKAAGLTLAQAQEMAAAQKASSSSSKSSGSKGSGSGSGSGATDTTTSSNAVKEARGKLDSMTSNDARYNYLVTLVERGDITEEDANALYAEFEFQNYRDLIGSTSGWSVVNDGGTNWLWGVDGNAVVVAPNGEQLTLDELVDALVEEGMSKSEAKDKVKNLQKELGI